MRKLLAILIAVSAVISITRQFSPQPRATTSIAVLPFVEYNSADQNYFAEGVTEEINNRLDQAGLDVVPGESAGRSRSHNINFAQIAQTLRVDAVLQGNIRRIGGRLHATVTLFDAKKGSVAWTDDLDLAAHSTFALQDQLATAVVPSVSALLIK